jgi:hypothetical protein
MATTEFIPALFEENDVNLEDEVDGTGWGLPGRNAVAVIGYGLWQQLFGGDPKALGATVGIDGIPLIVIDWCRTTRIRLSGQSSALEACSVQPRE